ncbi:unnamed protein product [Mytilus coruscus]|uniref:Uncharacterized protein n=1 Tax=Mytilus coruscus TaxID=42192 RepID=A0A6J7ZUE2_MYTCO|nr:unnamed protein product [Mytilus coruscus]
MKVQKGVFNQVSSTENPYLGWGNSTRDTLSTRRVGSLNVTEIISTTEKPYLEQDESTRTLPTRSLVSLNVTDLMSTTEKPYWVLGNSTRSTLRTRSVGSLNVTDLMSTTDKPYWGWGNSPGALRMRHRHTTDTIREYEDIGSVSADHSYTAMQQNTGRGSYIQPRSPYINHHTNTLISKIEEYEFTGEKSEDNQYSQMKDHHHYVDIIA